MTESSGSKTTTPAAPKPLLKWPGGKRRVLPELTKYIPHNYNTFYEPFLGGATVALHLNPGKAFLGDINAELINLYETVKADPEALIVELKNGTYINDLETFLKVRAFDRDEKWLKTATPVQRAARTIYLNRTGFNGLYRVNSKNQFNAHYGHYANPLICDTANIRAVHEAWSKGKTTFQQGSFTGMMDAIQGSQHFIYCDPPYIPLTATSSFTSYTQGGFGSAEQQTLATAARRLDEGGNFLLLSNSDTPATRELYEGFIIKPINVLRTISAGSGSRGKVGEVLILGATLAEHLGVTGAE